MENGFGGGWRERGETGDAGILRAYAVLHTFIDRKE